MIQRLAGFSRNETIGLFRRAKIFVDLFLPGKERASFESALFDAIPLIDYLGNGQDHRDFPPEAFPRLDVEDVDFQLLFGTRDPGLACASGFANELSSLETLAKVDLETSDFDGGDSLCHHLVLADRLIRTLQEYERLRGELRRVQGRLRALPGHFADSVVEIFSSRHVQIATAVSTSLDFDWLLPFVVSSFAVNALAPIYIFVHPKVRCRYARVSWCQADFIPPRCPSDPKSAARFGSGPIWVSLPVISWRD
jgi:hypothetical protein